MSVQVADLVATLRGEDRGFLSMMGLAGRQIGDLTGATGGAMGGVAKLGLALTGLAVGGLAASVKAASDYQTMLAHIQANTGMTNRDIAVMSAGIQQMASQTGAPLAQLADGFMHIHNFGFSAADAMKILQPAMESALSTGDDVAKVASTLGVTMHEFHLQTSQAAAAMNVLHVAAQEGNSTLGEFVDGTTKAFNLAGAYRVSLVDVAAALSTLTQSGQTARAASDGISAAMQGIVKPTAAAKKELLELGGKKLLDEFTAAGLKQHGLAGVLLDVKNAIAKSGMNPEQAINALFPNIRASKEVMLLLESQFGSFQQHLADMGDTMAGKTNPTLAGFTNYMHLSSTQLKILLSNVQLIAIQIGNLLLPVLSRATAALVPFLQTLSQHGLGAALGKLGEDITGAFTRVDWRVVAHNATTGLYTVFLTMQGWLQNTGIPFLQGRLTDITLAFKSIDWAGIGTTIKDSLGNLKDKVPVVISAAWQWASTTVGDLKHWLDTHGDEIKKDTSQKVTATVQAVTIGIQATWAWAKPYLTKLSTWIADNLPLVLAGEAGVAAALLLKGAPIMTLPAVIAIAAGFAWAKNSNLGPITDWVNANASTLLLSGGVSLAVLLATKNTQLATISGIIAVTASYAWNRPDGKPSDLQTWVNEQLKRGKGKAIDALDIFSAIGASVDDPKNEQKFRAWAGDLINKMVYWIGQQSAASSTAFSNAVGSAASAVADGFKNVPQAIYNYLAGRVKGVASVKDEITHYFADAGTWLKDAGGRLIKGLWDGMTNNPFFQKIMDFFNTLKGWWGKLGNVSYSGGSVTGMPLAYSGSGFGASGPVNVTVNAGAITVTGLGTSGANSDMAHALAQAFGEFTRQMVQAQRGVTNTVQRSVPGAV